MRYRCLAFVVLDKRKKCSTKSTNPRFSSLHCIWKPLVGPAKANWGESAVWICPNSLASACCVRALIFYSERMQAILFKLRSTNPEMISPANYCTSVGRKCMSKTVWLHNTYTCTVAVCSWQCICALYQWHLILDLWSELTSCTWISPVIKNKAHNPEKVVHTLEVFFRLNHCNIVRLN